LLPFFWVGQNSVCFLDQEELFRSVLDLRHVGMATTCETPVRGLDGLLIHVWLDAKNLVNRTTGYLGIARLEVNAREWCRSLPPPSVGLTKANVRRWHTTT
jgi:hypothetical protein